jgi:hypothetical protein
MRGKRMFLAFGAFLGMVALAGLNAHSAGQRQGPPPTLPTPQSPSQQSPLPRLPRIGDASNDPSLGDDGPASKVDPKQILKENQKKLNSDVEHLVQLAQELKEESAKTKETDVLSLPLIHKAEEIEKLAHQIKDLARSN